MRRFLLLTLLLSSFLLSCSHDNDEPEPQAPAEFTFLIFQPTTRGANPDLTPYMDQDLREVDQAVKNGLTRKANVIVFRGDLNISKLYRKELRKNSQGRDTVVNVLLREYPVVETDYTSFTGLKRILTDVIAEGKTEHIGMTIGCHADGWLPTTEDKSARAPMMKSYGQGYHGDYDTTYKTLAKAIEATGRKFEFILLDNCYSQNIEVAYDLRNACRFLLGSVIEIGSDGLDYNQNLPLLLQADYKTVCQNFVDYYAGSQWASAAFSAIDCSYLDQMAALMKLINASSSPFKGDRGSLQVFDGYDFRFGYYYNVFYDFGDYVTHLCSDPALLSQYHALLSQMVVANVHTPSFCSMYFPPAKIDGQQVPRMRDIRTCSGITCSDPCTELAADWQKTSWYMATH